MSERENEENEKKKREGKVVGKGKGEALLFGTEWVWWFVSVYMATCQD